VARVSAPRAPAAPTAESQVARRARILRSAAELGAAHGFDGVQMQEVAKDAGVALGTVYRYFPSKIQLFLAVMGEQMFSEQPPSPAADHDADAVGRLDELLVGWMRRLTHRRELALAMVRSTLVSYASASADARGMDMLLVPTILACAAVDLPTEDDRGRARLLLYAWWGVVVSRVSEHMSEPEAEAHIRSAARLIFTPSTSRP